MLSYLLIALSVIGMTVIQARFFIFFSRVI